MGILQGVYFGLGVGVGKMAGGLLIGQIGASYTFFVYGGMCTLVLGWFILIQKVSMQLLFKCKVSTNVEKVYLACP